MEMVKGLLRSWSVEKLGKVVKHDNNSTGNKAINKLESVL